MKDGFFTNNFRTFLLIPACIICVALIMTIFASAESLGE